MDYLLQYKDVSYPNIILSVELPHISAYTCYVCVCTYVCVYIVLFIILTIVCDREESITSGHKRLASHRQRGKPTVPNNFAL